MNVEEENKRLRQALEQIKNAYLNGPVSENNYGTIMRMQAIAEYALSEKEYK
jgi:hypothetical protein